MQLDRLREEFIFDCRVRGLSPRTVKNYEKQTAYFLRFLLSKGKVYLESIRDAEILTSLKRQVFWQISDSCILTSIIFRNLLGFASEYPRSISIFFHFGSDFMAQFESIILEK